jgi:hypothetical protein
VSTQLTLSSPNTATPLVTSQKGSTTALDAFVKLTHTASNGVQSTATKKVTVRTPASLSHISDVDNADPTFGYSCEIHYSIRDQFGTVLPSNVPINEHFTAAPTADFAGMNWRRGAEGGALVSPSNWFDHIEGEVSTQTPTPVAPGAPNAAVKVYHWPGGWRVGSLVIGNGVLVKNLTWQKNRGFARHV